MRLPDSAIRSRVASVKMERMSGYHEMLHAETRTVHTPLTVGTTSRPLDMPIYQGHLFAFDDPDAMADAFANPGDVYFYNRLGNPTVRALESAVADLEGGASGWPPPQGWAP